MKHKLLLLLGYLALAGSGAAAPLGTTISYQGKLDDSGSPANGTYSFRFRLLGDATGTTQIGPVVDMPSLSLAGGLLNAPLDFGSGAFNADARWLEISVKAGGPGAAGDYIKLNPQPLPPAGSSQFARVAGDVLNGTITGAKLAPLAITTTHISDGSITAPKLGPASVTSGNVADNAITTAKISSGQVVKSLNVGATVLRDDVTLAAGANVTLTPNGNTVTIASSGSGGGPWATLNGNAYFTGGNVGIGTTTPTFPLHVNSTASGNSLLAGFLQPSLAGGAYNQIYFGRNGAGNACSTFTYTDGGANPASSYLSLGLWGSSFSFNVNGHGNVGVGTTAPGVKLHVLSSSSTAIFGESTVESGVGVFGKSTRFEGVRGEAQNINHGAIVGLHNGGGSAIYGQSRGNGVVGESTAGGVGVFGKSATWEGVHGETSGDNVAAVAGINLAGGTGVYGRSDGGGYAGHFAGRTRVCTLEIYGGCDLAEPFPMKEEAIEQGSVVVIDEEHPGRLKLSRRAYDTQVAGIISGANGINPGIALKQEGALDQGQNVALTGRVYVKADAGHGAIKPGDLLTTSETPGHAMKVTDHGRAQGAILGKAMSARADGKGLVLVLVTLQ